MSAPTVTYRGTPAGAPMRKGFRSLIAFSSNPTLSLWEKDVQPPSFMRGDVIDNTTMHNTLYETGALGDLIKIGEVKSKVAYTLLALPQIVALIQAGEMAFTVHYSNGLYLALFGGVKGFEPDTMSPPTQPEGTLTVIVTNFDPVAKVEAGPVQGTGT